MIHMKDKTFITTGPITRVIISVATPLMINNIIRTLYNLIDGLYVAQLSSEDFAAVSFIWPLQFLFISIGMGIGVASTALIAQYIGANKLHTARHYAQNAIFFSVVIGIIMAIIGYTTAPTFLSWMGASGTYLEKCIIYLQINYIALLFDFVYFSYQAILNSEGNTKSITIISTLSSLVNVVLDPLFIFDQLPFGLRGFNMGIAGAAWATVIAKITLLLMIMYTVRQKSRIQLHWKSFQSKWSTILVLCRVALPSALGYSGSAMGFTVLNGLIQSYGTNTLVAFSLGNRISDLLDQPQMGIGSSLTSIIGQNVGAGLIERAKTIFKQTNTIIIAMSIFSSALIFIFRQELLAVFISNDIGNDLWTQASEYLTYTAFTIFFMGLYSSYTGFFQGFGMTRYSMYMSVGRLWVLRLPFIWIFSQFTTLGSTGIWISMLLSNFLTVALATIVYKRKDWSQLAVLHLNESEH